MRPGLVTFYFLLFFFKCFSQTPLASKDSIINLSLHQTTYEFASLEKSSFMNSTTQFRLYIYNDDKDTIFLSKIEVGEECTCETPIVVDTVQVDGIGSKEVVIYRNCKGLTSLYNAMNNISDRTDISKHEIWNLDEKKILFEKTTFFSRNWDYNTEYSRSITYTGVEKTFEPAQGFLFYHYSFNIDSSGKITLKKIIGTDERFNDLEIYSFIDGKYIIID